MVKLSKKCGFMIVFLFVIQGFFSGIPIFGRADVIAAPLDEPVIINHLNTNLSEIPTGWINEAKESLTIAYGHTSHGSQLVCGMNVIKDRISSLYDFNNGGRNGALDFRDCPFSGASDLGNPNRTAWATATRNYLNSHPEVNVVMWSWCG